MIRQVTSSSLHLLETKSPATPVAWLLVLCVGFSSGCRRNDISEVRGKITYQGKSVSHGIINFIGADNQPRGGPIAADGTYACQVPLGNYAVIISAPALMPEDWHEGDPVPDLPPDVPEKYGQTQTSNLTATVTERNQTIDFDLP